MGEVRKTEKGSGKGEDGERQMAASAHTQPSLLRTNRQNTADSLYSGRPLNTHRLTSASNRLTEDCSEQK